jgi:hypothetical protein
MCLFFLKVTYWDGFLFLFFFLKKKGRWYEDLKRYENNLDEMASATLDQVKEKRENKTFIS